jgi:hypothetical protein
MSSRPFLGAFRNQFKKFDHRPFRILRVAMTRVVVRDSTNRGRKQFVYPRKIHSFDEIQAEMEPGFGPNVKIVTVSADRTARDDSRKRSQTHPEKIVAGCCHLPVLCYVSLKHTHISRNSYYKVMVLIAFKTGPKGAALAHINQEPVPSATRELAEKLRKALFPELQAGKIIANLTPLRLIDTEQKCYIRPESNLVDASLTVGYIGPLEMQQRRALKRPVYDPSPSVAAICAEISRETPERIAQFNVSDVFAQFVDFRNELGGLPSDQQGLKRRAQQEASQLVDSETDSDHGGGHPKGEDGSQAGD